MSESIKNLKESKQWYRIWSHLSREEQSYIVLQSYKRRVLKSEEVEEYSRVGLWKQRVNILFPMISGTLIYKMAPGLFNCSRLSKVQQSGRIVGSTLALWLLFQYYNPLQTKYDSLKQDLLWLTYERIGNHLIKLNQVLPRFQTENHINTQILQQIYQYKSPLVNILYPQETRALPLVDFSSWPSAVKVGKIIH